MTLTVRITFGRNIGKIPMSDLDWDLFKARAIDLAATHLSPEWTELHEGAGVYEGMTETSAIVTAANCEADPSERQAFMAAVADLATRYGQDCIMVDMSEPQFVEGALIAA